MTTTVRSPRLLVLSTTILTIASAALLGVPHGQEPSAPAVAPTVHATTILPSVPPATGASPTGRPAAGTAAPVAPSAATPPAVESALPPHGEGAAGDKAVQRNLVAAWPADLPASDERELLTAGRALLRADATGIGRTKWPTVFPDSGGTVAPAFATARFRIQAAIARRDHSPNKAVVHLVWAGTDRGGTFTDLRITDWHFTRTLTKGTATWTPQPRT
ncbi:hypothetical protein R6V09_14170 [Streptomyces sp. W16]|uniref:hypothetical protein n=1 Tax=Streptomyces sp. W16 TaxID=3076631 RepID=UPI00295BA0EC|nr:hypothetical protein [Streptomyces sp. W16]MDV9171261.1 hypothetical protein [Streptomyces sp. W16]